MDIFADEHMVEMNRKSNTRVGGGRKRTRLRSPYSPRNATPPPVSTPPLSSPASNSLPASDGPIEKPAENKSLNKDSSLPVAKEVQNSTGKIDNPGPQSLKQLAMTVEPATKEVGGASSLNSVAEPFKSSALPDERTTPTKTPLNKMNTSRKRERTPSPTPYPNAKRPSVPSHTSSSSSSKLTSALQGFSKGVAGGGGNHIVKSPSPGPGSGSGSGGGALMSLLGKAEISSASRVLAEEMHKQENAKLKHVILKEVRKQGKSEC